MQKSRISILDESSVRRRPSTQISKNQEQDKTENQDCFIFVRGLSSTISYECDLFVKSKFLHYCSYLPYEKDTDLMVKNLENDQKLVKTETKT